MMNSNDTSIVSSEPHPKKKVKTKTPDGADEKKDEQATSRHQHSSSSANSFDAVNEDALRAILVRTCASDHDALRKTCRRFSQILNSAIFRKERGDSGWAEVKCEIPTSYAFDKDSPPRQCRRFLVKIIVDEKVITDGRDSKFAVVLLPRIKGRFFGMCNSIEKSLQGLGVTLFTNNGRPRLSCLKQALASEDGETSKKPFLYIQDMELPREYRSLESTITPKVIRSLFLDTPLKDSYSMALYIPWAMTQFLEEDERREDHAMNMASIKLRDDHDDPLVKKQLEEREEHEKRFQSLTVQNIQQCFRVGFHQVRDPAVVNYSRHFYLYATPKDMKNKPLLSVNETLQVDVAMPPKPKDKMGAEKDLFELMQNSCESRQELTGRIEQLKQLPDPLLALKLQTARMTVDRLKDIMDMARALEFQLVRFCDCDIDILAEGMVRLNVLTNAFVSMKSTIKCLEEGSVNESSSQSDSLPTDLCTLRQRVLDAEDRTSVRDDMIRAIKRLETIDPSVAYENVAAALKRDNQEKAAAGLLEARTALEDFDVEVRKKVARIVEEAGSPDVIVKSHAIHACATKASPVYIDLLMSFLPEEGNARLRAANGLDFDMETPLMRAARNVDIENLSTSTRTYECCERLLELGADKSLVNSILGRTAFGAFYTKFRSVENYELTFDKHLPVEKLQSRNEARLRFHRLLMPRDGPTEADRALLNHDADENDDDNDDVDADDDDDDDANDDYGEYDDDDAYYYDDYDYGSD